MAKAIVSLSGGMDSATVLAEAVALHGSKEVVAVGFTYGSKHNALENIAAAENAAWHDVPFSLVDLGSVMKGFKSNLLKTGGAVPEGHYQQENMSDTVVPGRNLIFISVLTGLAWSKKAEEIWLGIHSGDHFIYEDCRPAFFHSINAAVITGSGDRVRLVAPYLHGNKTTIIRRGRELNVPYHLTRTCYTGETIACGKCGSCQERLEAWKEIGIQDPISYETRELIQKK